MVQVQKNNDTLLKNSDPNVVVTPARKQKDAYIPIIFFLGLAAVAALFCAVYEHAEYIHAKNSGNTASSDDLNGQSPANTYGSGNAPAADAPNTPGDSNVVGNTSATSSTSNTPLVNANPATQSPAPALKGSTAPSDSGNAASPTATQPSISNTKQSSSAGRTASAPSTPTANDNAGADNQKAAPGTNAGTNTTSGNANK